MATRKEESLMKTSSSHENSVTKPHLLLLPLEIRLKIYDLLLALPSLLVEPTYTTQHSPFRLKTPYPLTPQVLGICRQIQSEAAPVLYGSHSFSCAFSTLGIDKLIGQIGSHNFTFIRHLIIDWVNLPRIASSFQKAMKASLYRNLDTLTIQNYVKIDLTRPVTLLDADLCELLKNCLCARAITQQHAFLKVIGQTCARPNRRAAEDDRSDVRICWRFLHPQGILRSNEKLLDLEKLITWIEDILGRRLDPLSPASVQIFHEIFRPSTSRRPAFFV